MGLYETLGVERGADAGEIRKAYLRLSRTAHPDKGGSEEEFKKIQQAYEVLSDDQSRAFYDQTGQIPGEEGGGGGGGPGGGMPFPFDIGSMFGGMFGGGFGPGGMPFGPGRPAGVRQQKRPKGPPKVHEIGLTLEGFFYGKKFQMKFERQKFCAGCKGEGAEAFETCGVCGGAGFRQQNIMIGPGMMASSRAPCGPCGGEGKTVKKVCKGCNGSKFQKEEKVLVATVEPGMRPGETLVFERECSDQHEYVEPGDVHIVLREAEESPGSSLRRSGDDLAAVLTVPFRVALLGGKEVLRGHPAHPDGIGISIPTGSMRGDVIRVEGEGMPRKGSGGAQRGALSVTLSVDVTEEDKKVLRENSEAIGGFFN
jgi:DnaJ-class molecular chaperone